MQDFDIWQCAALVNTQHGIVNLIMNEYAYSGQGPTIYFLTKLNGPNILLMTSLPV